jgi:mannose-6-phosphate isomerase-like protein (cupin superfamily)
MVIRLDDCAAEPTRHGTPKRVLLGNGILPGVTQVAVANFPEPTETELHSHPTMYEVYFVLEGRAVYTIGEERHDVSAGDFFFVPPGVTHNQRVTQAPHRIFYWGISIDRTL